MYLTLEAAAYMSMAALVDLLRPTASPQTIHPPTYRREPDGVVDLRRRSRTIRNLRVALCTHQPTTPRTTALPPPVWRTRVVAAKAIPPSHCSSDWVDVLQSLPGE